MGGTSRAVLAFVTAVATFYFVFWVGGALLMAMKLPVRSIGWVATPAAIAAAAAVAAFVWRRSASAGGALGIVLRSAVVTGAIGFCLGFFGPLIFTPGANQGPLLGIFITGPLGFVLGAIGGWVKWAARRARESDPSTAQR